MAYIIVRHAVCWLLFNLLHWSGIPSHADFDGRFWQGYLTLAAGCYDLGTELRWYRQRRGVR